MSKKIKAITGTKKNRVYHLAATESNSDFIRAARLVNKTDQKSKDKLKKLDEAETVSGA